MFSSPFYLNDTIQDELDNYSYHTSFESNQTDLGYVNSNFLIHQTATSQLNEDANLSQLNLTPKKWSNQNRSATNFNLLNNQQEHTQSNTQVGERRMINARRYLPFSSLADRNIQATSTPNNNLFTNTQFIKKCNFDNLRIIRQNSYLAHDSNRSKNCINSSVSIFRMLFYVI